MLILIADQPSPMDVKVLVLILTLIFALEALKVLKMLLFQSELEVFKLSYLLLIIMDSLPHAIFLVLHNE